MAVMRTSLCCLAGWFGASLSAFGAEPAAPSQMILLFNGKDLNGLTPWLKETMRDDPRKVFQAEEGAIHVTGEGSGYLATKSEYRDYHLTVEYKWGQRTNGGKY